MGKKILAAVLLLAMLLSVTSCGNDATAGGTRDPGGTVSRPAGGAEQTRAPEGEGPQPTEGPAAETASYIFSDRPAAAYEVTGLDLQNIYDGHYIDADGYDNGTLPLVKLTPGENSFIIFCMLGDENEPDTYKSISTVRSPAGSGKWEARTYSCLDILVDPVPEGCALLEREDYIYTEEDYGGRFTSLLDPWLDWILFAEIYHPDAPQDDAVYAITVMPYSFDEDHDELDEVLASVVNSFAALGGAAAEIPLDEALARCRVEVS